MEVPDRSWASVLSWEHQTLEISDVGDEWEWTAAAACEWKRGKSLAIFQHRVLCGQLPPPSHRPLSSSSSSSSHFHPNCVNFFRSTRSSKNRFAQFHPKTVSSKNSFTPVGFSKKILQTRPSSPGPPKKIEFVFPSPAPFSLFCLSRGWGRGKGCCAAGRGHGPPKPLGL